MNKNWYHFRLLSSGVRYGITAAGPLPTPEHFQKLQKTYSDVHVPARSYQPYAPNNHRRANSENKPIEENSETEGKLGDLGSSSGNAGGGKTKDNGDIGNSGAGGETEDPLESAERPFSLPKMDDNDRIFDDDAHYDEHAAQRIVIPSPAVAAAAVGEAQAQPAGVEMEVGAKAVDTVSGGHGRGSRGTTPRKVAAAAARADADAASDTASGAATEDTIEVGGESNNNENGDERTDGADCSNSTSSSSGARGKSTKLGRKNSVAEAITTSTAAAGPGPGSGSVVAKIDSLTTAAVSLTLAPGFVDPGKKKLSDVREDDAAEANARDDDAIGRDVKSSTRGEDPNSDLFVPLTGGAASEQPKEKSRRRRPKPISVSSMQTVDLCRRSPDAKGTGGERTPGTIDGSESSRRRGGSGKIHRRQGNEHGTQENDQADAVDNSQTYDHVAAYGGADNDQFVHHYDTGHSTHSHQHSNGVSGASYHSGWEDGHGPNDHDHERDGSDINDDNSVHEYGRQLDEISVASTTMPGLLSPPMTGIVLLPSTRSHSGDASDESGSETPTKDRPDSRHGLGDDFTPRSSLIFHSNKTLSNSGIDPFFSDSVHSKLTAISKGAADQQDQSISGSGHSGAGNQAFGNDVVVGSNGPVAGSNGAVLGANGVVGNVSVVVVSTSDKQKDSAAEGATADPAAVPGNSKRASRKLRGSKKTPEGAE